MRRWLNLSFLALGLLAAPAMAQLPGLVSQPISGGGQSWSLPVQTLVFITSLTFLPAILLMMTSFTRIIIVSVCCVTRSAPRPRRQTRCCWASRCS